MRILAILVSAIGLSVRALTWSFRAILRIQCKRKESRDDSDSTGRSLDEIRMDPCQQLCDRNWRAMRGEDFEQFLVEVLQTLGKPAKTTKASGDQGIDIIVLSDGLKIGVQVKGYHGSVGNRAVQEAFAGGGFYDCDACAVITNSRFTDHARELAKKIGCILVDETVMYRFILGELPPFESAPRYGGLQPIDDLLNPIRSSNEESEASFFWWHLYLMSFTTAMIVSGVVRIWLQRGEQKGAQNLVAGLIVLCAYAMCRYKWGSKTALFVTTLMVVAVTATLIVLRVSSLFGSIPVTP